jgi:hypothetical protein
MKMAIGYIHRSQPLPSDVTVKASSKNELNLQNLIKIVRFFLSTLFFSRTMCLGFTITVSWSKMPLLRRKFKNCHK